MTQINRVVKVSGVYSRAKISKIKAASTHNMREVVNMAAKSRRLLPRACDCSRARLGKLVARNLTELSGMELAGEGISFYSRHRTRRRLSACKQS